MIYVILYLIGISATLIYVSMANNDPIELPHIIIAFTWPLSMSIKVSVELIDRFKELFHRKKVYGIPINPLITQWNNRQHTGIKRKQTKKQFKFGRKFYK